MSKDSGTGGAWQQFLVARKRVLDEYDQARAHAKEQIVQVHHGVVGEAAVRDWLTSFLPKRYGVVSGYVRSQSVPEPHQTSHFDVIIYDQIEAPTLWVEVNKDKSQSGLMRIIPAEHVRAIIEVKAAFNKSSVKSAIEKLSELAPLTGSIDPGGEKYPKYLPASAVLGMVFFEARQADKNDVEAVNMFRSLPLGRHFYGAVILRGEGLEANQTAILHNLVGTDPIEELFVESCILGHVAMTSSVEVDGKHAAAILTWADTHFSQFAFDLLALLNGTYRQGFVSSFHGLDLSHLKH